MDFQLEKNVPDVYVDESRDFQLFCRVLDIYLKGCADRAADMIYQLDIDRCNESLLYAIAHMQGFVTSMAIPSNVLRNILKVFPWCLKRKGTEEAIKVASYAVMATYKNIYNIDVEIINSHGEYRVTVSLAGTDKYLEYVREVLRFLVPAGYEVEIKNVVIYSTSEDDRAAIEDYVARVSGIPGVIMGANRPLSFELDESAGTGSTPGFYSRFGYAKIIRSTSSSDFLEQKSVLNGKNTEEVDLIDKDGKPVFVHGNMKVNQ